MIKPSNVPLAAWMIAVFSLSALVPVWIAHDTVVLDGVFLSACSPRRWREGWLITLVAVVAAVILEARVFIR